MNKSIKSNLKILEQYYIYKKDTWRIKAYKNAIKAIKSLDFEITDIKQLKNVKSIGKGITQKIKQLLDTGKIDLVEKIKQETSERNKVLEKFTKIWGIGIVKAEKLYEQNITTIQQLRQNQHLLTANQIIGLKYYQDLQKKIPRQYITIFKNVMKLALGLTYGLKNFKMEIAGSYRRKQDSSGDIDCLITSEKINLQQIVDTLQEYGIITDVLSMKQEKFMGIVHCPNNQWFHFRLDIEFLPKDEWGSGLLYFTGSQNFNVETRTLAKKLGLRLNQHGLFDLKNNRLPVYTERQILKRLGMKYVEPENRV